ncbi:U-box domain-containing protein 33, putative isoform 2 [Hibiscus syriacus]|uniref:RING-type E3 ubiquitin transferase n=1 Tax=Hibiscus syriacus TaxID=106335 RepID=A0A6A3B2E2_HIBSY|nr:U-box domain-containing protein 33-like [Hibiscus syriacus]KAE8709412.1 U-box domain-containing protein 33, putative isoform 2 [Hibiscus syriacus]
MATASDDTIYVAVGEVEGSELTLLWVLHNLNPRKVCILLVHQPSRVISSMYGVDGFLDEIMFDQRQIRGLEEVGKDMMNRIMDESLLFCSQAGVSAISIDIQMDDVAKGILELIRRHNIKKLVMGAAADERFSEGMWLMSEKAQYLNENAPLSCQIWFICKEHLVHTRFETGQSSNALSSSASSYLTSFSEAAGILESTVFDERDESECELELYEMLGSGEEGSSNDQLFDQLEQALQEVESSNRKAFEESDKCVKAEMNATLAMRQAKTFERLYNECKREKETALTKQKESIEKIKRLREEEHSVAREQKSILETRASNSNRRMKQLEDELASAMEQLQVSLKEQDELQIELQNSRRVIDELLRKQAEETSSTHMNQFNLDLLQIVQKEKDELQVKLENTCRINKELLRKQSEDNSSSHLQQHFKEFSLSEIEEATEGFYQLYKIAEGAQGNVYYKCVLRHTEVAVKLLGRSSFQDPFEVQQEVDDMIKSRHPNLVTIIGACPGRRALIYEYVPNGSLEDHLNCRDDIPPLSWQSRLHIATQLCSTLMFLHSGKQVHGNLKPGNILLDENLGCKLTDFGIHRALSLLENSNNMTESSNANPYLDPDFRRTRSVSHSLDLYPFGVILLQLLSGRSTQGIAEIAQNELLNGGNLSSFLDSSAGNWPHQVAQLTHLAIRCCDINRTRRPDLASDVFKVLETMKPSGALISHVADSKEDNLEPPSYFICPILQEVMTDPHMAADGYTYEAPALQDWLADHDTSPMTNLRLQHLDLIPNFPLRSAIQQWQQNH